MFFQEKYRQLVNELLIQQHDASYYERLAEAFNSLTPPDIHLNIDRPNKLAFMQKFDKFLVSVRGFLCVK